MKDLHAGIMVTARDFVNQILEKAGNFSEMTMDIYKHDLSCSLQKDIFDIAVIANGLEQFQVRNEFADVAEIV